MSHDLIFSLMDGNPGAANAVGQVMSSNLTEGFALLERFESLEIRGTDLYVVWSDLFKRDTTDMINRMALIPDEVLKDASSRQDRSGVELVAPYLVSAE